MDPEDPLYGLEHRLRKLHLDEESRKIIKEKLDEAHNKVKFALDERQKNLDAKLTGNLTATSKKKWSFVKKTYNNYLNSTGFNKRII